MRSFLIYLALTCAVALVTPAFWWLLANRTGVTVGEAVEADGARRTVMTGPKAPWPDWAWTPEQAQREVRIMNGAAPGHPAAGFAHLKSSKAPRELIGTVREALVTQGWTVAEYRYDGPEPTIPPRQMTMCTLRATRSDPERTLTYVFTPDRSPRIEGHWIDGPPPGPWMTGVEQPC